MSAKVLAGKHLTEKRNKKVSEGLKLAYQEGRRKRGHSKETRERIRQNNQTAKETTIMGQTFTSRKAAAEFFGVSLPTIKRWAEGKFSKSQKRISVRGVVYPSLSQAARELGVKFGTLSYQALTPNNKEVFYL